MSPRGLESWTALERSTLLDRFTCEHKLIRTWRLEPTDVPASLGKKNWAAVLEHECIPFISYPSEWCFGMLRDAALLTLELLAAALDENLILQDATPFNVQWRGSQPVFIDIPSLVPLRPGQPWAGYRQFCEQFLFPLMLQAYKGVPFQPWLRGRLDGIPAEHLARLMSWRDLLRPGVLTHVCLQARLQARYAQSSRNLRDEFRAVGFRKEFIAANVQRMTRLVNRLSPKPANSVWIGYEQASHYDLADRQLKEAFVRRAVAQRHWNLVWDIGCNVGRFSRIAAQNARLVLALDSDEQAIDRLYQELRAEGHRSILPLVADVADLTPNRGWRGRERRSLPARGRPELVLCLALIHHLVLGIGVPLREVVDWLASLCQHVVLEFVTRDDPMARMLLRHKDEHYEDYSLDHFEECFGRRFELLDRQVLSSRTRILYHGRIRNSQSG